MQIQSEKSRQPLTKKTLIDLAKVLYSKAYVEELKWEFSRAEKIDQLTGDNWHTQQILDRYENRRGSLSNFMQEVKERIASHHLLSKEDR